MVLNYTVNYISFLLIYRLFALIYIGSVDKFHPWVNGEALLEKCLIGFVMHDTDD